MNNFIKKILVSEKSFQSASSGKFTFAVDKHVDKETLARAIENLFKVTVLSVNTMNYSGKIKTTKKNKGKRADFKKAVLTLKPGDKIDLFEIEKETDEKKGKKEKKVKIEDNKDVKVSVKEKKK